jgi:hypothetical protein
MGDEQQRATETEQEFLQPGDGIDVQVVGGLVQQQQVRLVHQGARQQHPALEPAGQVIEGQVGVQLQPRQHGLDPLLQLPAVAAFQFMLGAFQLIEVGAASRPSATAQAGGMVAVQQRRHVAKAAGDDIEQAAGRPGHILGQAGDSAGPGAVDIAAVRLRSRRRSASSGWTCRRRCARSGTPVRPVPGSGRPRPAAVDRRSRGGCCVGSTEA